MLFECNVIKVFDTSIGKIVVLGFYTEVIPYVGMFVKDDLGLKWKILGIGTNRIFNPSNNELNESYKSIWDCKIAPVEHTKDLKAGNNLSVVY